MQGIRKVREGYTYMVDIRNAVLSTLLYADLFECPLDEQELFAKLQKKPGVSKEDFKLCVEHLVHKKEIVEDAGYYYLPNRHNLRAVRKKRLTYTREKIFEVKKRLRYLTVCPWVQAIYLTGSLAAGNCREEDDIDFLIVTDTNRLWLTRLWLLVIAGVLGVRRKPLQAIVSNRWCFNIFLEEQSLTLPQNRRNLFTAHELVQALLIWTCNRNANMLLSANPWIVSYLPNTQILHPRNSSYKQNRHIHLNVLHYINKLSFYLQYWYMKKRITMEIVTLSEAYFHPVRKSPIVLKHFETGKKYFGLI